MQRIIILVILVILVFPLISIARGLVGLENPAPYTWQLKIYDTETGATEISTNVLSSFAINGGTVIDNDRNLYFIQIYEQESGDNALLGIDLTSGEEALRLPWNPINNIDFDPASGKLIGLQNPAAHTWQFVKVNPNNGNTEFVGPQYTGFDIQCSTSVDPTNSKYYFPAFEGTKDTSYIKEMSIDTGKITNSFPANLTMIVYDSETGNLVGLQNPADYTWQLSQLDLSDGSISKIGPQLCCFALSYDGGEGGASLDPENRIYYIGTDDGIKMINVDTGQLVGVETMTSRFSSSSNIDLVTSEPSQFYGGFKFSPNVYVAKRLNNLKITGPDTLKPGESARYQATATWNTGSSSVVTPSWEENSPYATMSADGVLKISPQVFNQKTVTITAKFIDSGVAKSTTFDVSILHNSITIFLNLLLDE